MLTASEFRARFGGELIEQLADRDADGIGEPQTLKIAIADAEAEVMPYLRAAGFSTPPEPAPEFIKRIIALIARYNLYQRDLPQEHPAYVAYQDALRELRAISRGEIPLTDARDTGGIAGWAPKRDLTDAVLGRLTGD